jgi:hypothetical protein
MYTERVAGLAPNGPAAPLVPDALTSRKKFGAQRYNMITEKPI